MLVVKVKTEETIHIGQEITITVFHIGRSVVKLGIDAPETEKVHWPNRGGGVVKKEAGGSPPPANGL